MAENLLLDVDEGNNNAGRGGGLQQLQHNNNGNGKFLKNLKKFIHILI
jgi:hypothetical protein